MFLSSHDLLKTLGYLAAFARALSFFHSLLYQTFPASHADPLILQRTMPTQVALQRKTPSQTTALKFESPSSQESQPRSFPTVLYQ